MHTEKGKHDYEDTILGNMIYQIIIKKLKVAEECLWSVRVEKKKTILYLETVTIVTKLQ